MVEKMYSPQETADILGIKKRTVEEWLRNGKLKGVKVGRLWRIKESEIDRIQKDGE